MAERSELLPQIDQLIGQIRQTFLARPEELHGQADLPWFDQQQRRAATGQWRVEEITDALVSLRESILVRRGVARRQEGEGAVAAATSKLEQCMQEVGRLANDHRLGGDRSGVYGHCLLYLMEEVASRELGVEQAPTQHPSVQPIFQAVLDHTDEECLK